jgi:hypothetical protein
MPSTVLATTAFLEGGALEPVLPVGVPSPVVELSLHLAGPLGVSVACFAQHYSRITVLADQFAGTTGFVALASQLQGQRLSSQHEVQELQLLLYSTNSPGCQWAQASLAALTNQNGPVTVLWYRPSGPNISPLAELDHRCDASNEALFSENCTAQRGDARGFLADAGVSARLRNALPLGAERTAIVCSGSAELRTRLTSWLVETGAQRYPDCYMV